MRIVSKEYQGSDFPLAASFAQAKGKLRTVPCKAECHVGDHFLCEATLKYKTKTSKLTQETGVDIQEQTLLQSQESLSVSPGCSYWQQGPGQHASHLWPCLLLQMWECAYLTGCLKDEVQGASQLWGHESLFLYYLLLYYFPWTAVNLFLPHLVFIKALKLHMPVGRPLINGTSFMLALKLTVLNTAMFKSWTSGPPIRIMERKWIQSWLEPPHVRTGENLRLSKRFLRNSKGAVCVAVEWKPRKAVPWILLFTKYFPKQFLKIFLQNHWRSVLKKTRNIYIYLGHWAWSKHRLPKTMEKVCDFFWSHLAKGHPSWWAVSETANTVRHSVTGCGCYFAGREMGVKDGGIWNQWAGRFLSLPQRGQRQ